MTAGVLICRCHHHARQHRPTCKVCRARGFRCPAFVSNDATPAELEPVPVLPTQIDLFKEVRAA